MASAVCFECINDVYLKRTVKEEGHPLTCSVCGGTASNAFNVKQLAEIVDRIMSQHFIRGFKIQENGNIDEKWVQEGDPMSRVVQKILNQYLNCADEIVDEIIESEKVYVEPFWNKFNNYVERRTEPWIYFREWESTLVELKHSRRFFSQAAKTLFGKLFEGVDDLRGWNGKIFQPVARILPTGTKLFRARICKSESMLRDFKRYPYHHIGPPPKEQTPAGRMNPEGVTVFYGTREMDTCFAEMRPALGNDVAIITLKTTKPLRVLDFSRLERIRRSGALSFFQPDYIEQIEKQEFLHHIHRLISQPVVPGRETDYLITQTMAEYLAHVHQKPFDGILFDSTQREKGINVVLFAQEKLLEESLGKDFGVSYIPNSVKLFSTTSIKYKRRESDAINQISEVEGSDDGIPF